MDKLKMESMNMISENTQWVKQRFPNAVTEVEREGKLEYAIDFDILKQELSSSVINDKEDRYQFTWPDKKRSILTANTPVKSTLRPCKEESVDFDTTQNLYIEGDNLDVLKLLRETYIGKIQIIYIDPPYNTGNDFIYEDNFTQSTEDYIAISGDYDEIGYRMFQNTDSNGRFHTDWLNMIYPRLKVAKDLLSDDGVIFISMGQSEISNLMKICSEIFGESNFIGNISRLMKSGGNKGQFFSPNVEYILVYAKNISMLGAFREPLTGDTLKSYSHVEESGSRKGERFTVKGLCQPGLGIRPNQRYWIQAPDDTFLIPKGKNFPSKVAEGEKIMPTGEDTCWRWTYDRYKEEKEKGNVYFSKASSATALVDETGNIAKWNVCSKIWLNDRQEAGRVPVDIITKWENRISSSELKELDIPFDFAKPTDLIVYLISIVDSNSDATILDFFSGSATTAHAVMQHNVEYLGGGGTSQLKYIMVQLPEPCKENSEALKAGYKNICEIGKERIRRAGVKIKAENGLIAQNLDIGFRVLKLDSSNMKDVYYKPSGFKQSLLDEYESNIKEDRTPLDLLFQVMLETNKMLSAKIEEKEIAGKKVFVVDDGDLVCCFDKGITDEIIVEIAKSHPLYAVFRDSSFETDSIQINFDQIFAAYSPNTKRRVL